MSQRYYAEMKMQEDLAQQLRHFKQGNAVLPLDWLKYHHILPYATDAGKVGPAGGYADVLRNKPDAYAMPAQMGTLLASQWYWAAAAVGLYLYLR